MSYGYFSKYDREVVRVFQIREHHAQIVKLGRYGNEIIPCLFQTMCYVVPVKDIRNLGVNWSIPDLHDYYKTNVSYILVISALDK